MPEMAQTTYFVAMAVERNDSGYFVAVNPTEALSRNKAIQAAEAFAEGHRGAVAFSRIGDPETGEFEDAVELARFGDLPDDLSSVFS